MQNDETENDLILNSVVRRLVPAIDKCRAEGTCTAHIAAALLAVATSMARDDGCDFSHWAFLVDNAWGERPECN